MRSRMVAAWMQMGQQQQQRTVADVTKPQAAVKGGESPHGTQTKVVSRPPVPWIRTKVKPPGIVGAPAPQRKASRSPGEWQLRSSLNPADCDRWRVAYEEGFRLRQAPWRA